jgi:hypothetical protein
MKFFREMGVIMESPLTPESEADLSEVVNKLNGEAILIIDANTYDLKEIKDGDISLMIADAGLVDIKLNATIDDRKASMKADVTLTDGGESATVGIEANLNSDPNARFTIVAPEDAMDLNALGGLGGI